ncbi:MAG: DUF4359 domain-containing protein, partial [Bacteroidota bacterium]
MTPFRVFVAGMVLIAILLYILNPGPEKFNRFIQQELADMAAEEAGEAPGLIGDVSSIVARRIGERIGSLAADAFERDNYVFASVYRYDMNGRSPGGEWEFLGIAAWFIPLDTPEF